jgi:Icc-related predicted phosphoesterase
MRIYFCSDLHGSDKCWKKFLSTPKFYGADVIIVGGDVTGKFLVPVVESRRGKYTCRFNGLERKVSGGAQLQNLLDMIADAGAYGFVTTPDEYQHYQAEPEAVDKLFRRLILERVDRWLELAEDKLRGKGVRVLVSGANDDFFEVDEALGRSELIEDPNGRVLPLGEGYEIMGMGYGNFTPWDCPRDISEEELTQRIDEVMATAEDPGKTVMSLHVPPYDCGLDHAPELDDQLRAVVTPNGPKMIPVGSTATRAAVTTYRPALGLHGHIHESRGVTDLHGVPIGNPGSEYSEGILGGLVIDLDRRHGLTTTTLVRG